MPSNRKIFGYYSVSKRLLEELSAKEKQHFDLFIRTELPKSSYAKYTVLINSLNKSSPPIHTIPKLFKDFKLLDDGFRQLRTKLIDFICLLRKREPLEFALSMGLERYAKDRLGKDIRFAVEQQDIYAIYKTYLTCREYGFWHIAKTLGKKSVIHDGLLKEYFTLARAESFYLRANQYVNQSVGDIFSHDRRVLFDEHVDEIRTLVQPHFFPRTKARIYLAQAIWFLLVRDYEAVQPVMAARIEVMKAYPDMFPVQEVFNTTKTLFKVYLAGKRFDLIAEYLYEMGGLEGPTQIKSKEILGHWFYFSITQAACGGNMDLGRVALKSIKQLPDIFEKMDLDLIMVASAMIAAYDNRWEEVRYLLKRVDQRGYRLHAQVLFLRMISYFEQGEISEARRQAKYYFQLWRREIGEQGADIADYLELFFKHWCSADFKPDGIELEAGRVMKGLKELVEGKGGQESVEGKDEQGSTGGKKEILDSSPLVAWLYAKSGDGDIKTAIEVHGLKPLLRMGLPEAEV